MPDTLLITTSDQALAIAAEDAHRKLHLLAKAAGMSLPTVTETSEITPLLPLPEPTLMRVEMALHSAISNTFVPENLSFAAEART